MAQRIIGRLVASEAIDILRLLVDILPQICIVHGGYYLFQRHGIRLSGLATTEVVE
jgi:hypothetical protein